MLLESIQIKIKSLFILYFNKIFLHYFDSINTLNMIKYRIVQNNILQGKILKTILHESLNKDEAQETLNMLSQTQTGLEIEEYNLPLVHGLGRDPDLH